MKEADRQRIATLLRRVRLLGVADGLLFVRDFLANFSANRAFRSANTNFAAPPALLAFDAYNTTSLQAYDQVGAAYAQKIVETLRERNPVDHPRILEWGCGPGRVIRQIAVRLGPDPVELHGTDYNPRSIAWCSEAIPGICFGCNGAEPPLAYPADHFDAVYAISVFTHLAGDSQGRWLAEIRRVLRPGGLFIFTTHGDNRLQKLSTEQADAFRRGELVVKGGCREGKKNFLAYHPRSYVENHLGRSLELRVFEDGMGNGLGQDYWVFAKPSIRV